MVEKSFAAWGAETVDAPWPGVYTALETGIYDAQEELLPTICDASLQKVQKYLCQWPAFYSAAYLCMDGALYDSLAELPEITNEDFVLGIRPEFLDIADEGNLRGEIYGAMPTGMESTIKVRVGGFLLTGVVFGSSLFTIGTEVPLSVTGDQIMLFDRKSGQCITSGTLNF